MTTIQTSLRLIAAAAAFAAIGTQAANAATVDANAKPSVVIVHGAFADGSDWSKVIPILQAKGVKVIAVQNPLTSLADDVAATRRAIAAQPGKVVLVGHSWGGTVIPTPASTTRSPAWSTSPHSPRTPASRPRRRVKATPQPRAASASSPMPKAS